MQLALVAGLLFALAFAAVAYRDHEQRQSIVRLVGQDLPAAAARLARRYPLPPRGCARSRPLADIDLLAGALAAVESLNAGILERTAEEALVRLAVLTGLPVPDFSIGPGQIRTSTARAAIEGSDLAGLSARDMATESPAIALQLLSPCRSLDWGVAVLRGLAGSEGLDEKGLSRQTVTELAAAYNSQAAAKGDEAAIANYLYRELTYQVFQEYRFLLRP